MSKINLNKQTVEQARNYAASIANQVQSFVDEHTTVAVERTICRLLGIDGINVHQVPYPNIVVDHLCDCNLLSYGVANLIGTVIDKTGLTPQEVAEEIDSGKLDLRQWSLVEKNRIRIILEPYVSQSIKKIQQHRQRREEDLVRFGDKTGPYLYVIVATGNIYEDIVQATSAAEQGADVIAVIRTTGQSLLDYVPYGPTTEGFGGTYATQANFRLMREALDVVGEKLQRYIRLCNYCSGLCMPEIAAMGALERLDVMLNDALYGILFRDINMQRTLIDQHFSRQINAFAGVIINTGEDNYLTTADAVEEAHTVLASQILNEQLAYKSGLVPEQMGLGHAFEIDPEVPGGFLMELAQAQLAREIFPRAPLKYMPPTKHMTGNIFRGYVQNALFNMVTALTGQKIHLLGMLTEAIHTPFMSDRALAIENARYIFQTTEGLAEEIEFKAGGKLQQRAQEVLDKACQLLADIESHQLFGALELGVFANIKRSRSGGKGLDGVARKSLSYFNPFVESFTSGGVKHAR